MLRNNDGCPSAKRISVRAQAALIAANTQFADSAYKCYDAELATVLDEKCGSRAAWKAMFTSDKWHAHADGHRLFGKFVHVELALLLTLFTVHLGFAFHLGTIRPWIKKLISNKYSN